MNPKALTFLLFLTLASSFSCNEISEQPKDQPTPVDNYESEKAAILEILNGETKAAFNRDYEGWKEHWVQESYVTKTYMQFPDTSMTETLGWKEIDDFVRTYIEEHPEPAPIPTLVDNIDVRLYGKGAWVSYEQKDAERGLKRETRLMEKINGQWKIAGMHTTIYGFQEKE